MRVTICGSIAFYEKMLEVKRELEKLGHVVKLPPHEVKDQNGKEIPVSVYYSRRKAETSNDSWIWDRKEEAMKLHFAKIEWCEAIIVLNYDKNEIQNYIGANTLIEMGLAQYLQKKIYLLNKVPEISYKEEILGMKPIVINSDLKRIGN